MVALAVFAAGGLAMYWRRNLPHWVPEDAELFVTWRVRSVDRSTPVWLSTAEVAGAVAEALLYGAEVRACYDLMAWVIMPDHIHIVIRPLEPLHSIMRWLKAATGNRANQILGRHGPFWAREYYDRWIRSDEELAKVIAYVEDNPVRKGLASCADEWRWSSAYAGPAAETAGSTSGLKVSNFQEG